MQPFGVLHAAFHEPGTRPFRVCSALVSAAIVLGVALLALEIVVPASYGAPWVRAVDRVIVWFFAVELLLRVGSFRPPALDVRALSPAGRLRTHVLGRLRFCLRPMMLVDIVTVLGAVPALRGLRAVRLVRLIRGARVLRYASPFEAIERALAENSVLYLFGMSAFGVTVVVGALAFYLSEHASNPDIATVPDALWWSVVTVTTVGYGDLTPATGSGRLIGAALMIAGMIILALFAGIVGSSLMGAVLNLRVEGFRMSDTVGHVVVCGYEPGAALLLDALAREIGPSGRQIVLFSPTERPLDVPPEFVWIQGDPTKESELDKLRLPMAHAVIVVGSRVDLPQIADARTILVVFTVRRYLRPHEASRRQPMYVVAEILDSENVEHARTAGADEVIETRRIGFHLLAHAVHAPGASRVVAELADLAHHSVFVGRPPAGGRFADVVARVLATHGAVVIGVRDAQGRNHLAPPPDREVGPDDEVLFIGDSAILPRR